MSKPHNNPVPPDKKQLVIIDDYNEANASQFEKDETFRMFKNGRHFNMFSPIMQKPQKLTLFEVMRLKEEKK